MAVVLAAIVLFVYVRFEQDLDAAIDRGLLSRVQDVVALVGEEGTRGIGDPEGQVLTESSESFAQIVGGSGSILDATAELRGVRLLSAEDFARARQGPISIERIGPLERDEAVRLLAIPIDVEGEPLVIVVGAALGERDDALRSLALLLILAGTAGLLLTSAVGYLLAGATLRPVDAMRRRAENVTESDTGRRLPLPPADDELRALGLTLNAMLDRLEAALTRERSFVADASHELRMPLATLKMEVEVALESEGDPAELRAALVSASEEVARLAQLAEDLLVIARSDRGRLPVRRAEVDLRVLLERLSDRFEQRLREAGRTLTVETGDAVGAAIDELRIEQALSNLVDNALRHGAGPITCSAVGRAGWIELHVVDAGDGIPDEFLADAFKRFTRADSSRARGGVGLGLAIVEVIAAAHGGSAHAGPSAAGGADVWITVPVPN